jgi:hypothetical protein
MVKMMFWVLKLSRKMSLKMSIKNSLTDTGYVNRYTAAVLLSG